MVDCGRFEILPKVIAHLNQSGIQLVDIDLLSSQIGLVTTLLNYGLYNEVSDTLLLIGWKNLPTSGDELV